MTVFERFTDRARAVVVTAQDEARRLGHGWIGAEHLMLGVLAQPDGIGVAELERLGVTSDAWRTALAAAFGPERGFGPRDVAALDSLGIDLDEIRRRAEEQFGPGALEPDPAGRPLLPAGRLPRLFRRRRGCGLEPNPTGHIPFTARAKRALERALREAQALGDRYIGVEHVILGLLDPEGNLATELLTHLQVDSGAARAAVLAARSRAA